MKVTCFTLAALTLLPPIIADAAVFPSANGGDRNTGQQAGVYMVIRDVDAAPLSQARIDEIRTLEDNTRRFYAANSGGTFDLDFAFIFDVPLTLDENNRRPSNWRTLARNYVQDNYGYDIEVFHSNIFDVNATTADEGQGWAGVYWGGSNDFAIQSNIASNWGQIVMDHELGHRVAADHARAWRNLNNNDYSSYVWDESSNSYVTYNSAIHGWQPLTFGAYRDEYGNPFDTMGNISNGHFRIREKLQDLGWLTDSQVPDLNSLGVGTYRIYAHDELQPVVSGDGVYGVEETYDPNVFYGLTYSRQGEQLSTSSGTWQSDTQRIDIEYRAGRDGVQFYLDGGIVDLDLEGGTNRGNRERELEVGQTIADIDINRSIFYATSGGVDFLSYNPQAPTDWSESLTEWFEFTVVGTGSDAIGSYAELSVTYSQLLNGIAGDLNQDGFFDSVDIEIFIANYGNNTSSLSDYERWTAGDLTQNGTIDLYDFYEMWLAGNAAGLTVPFPDDGATVPEPTTAMLCIGLAVALLQYRRKVEIRR